MLEVIIGMVFIYLLLSLLATTLNELMAAWRGWRGFYLEEALKKLLNYAEDPKLFEKFTSSGFFNQLRQHKTPLRVSRAPSYMSSSTFASIFFKVLKNKDQSIQKVEDFIAALPEESKLRDILNQLKEESGEKLEDFKKHLETWYEEVMARSCGWYKRHMQVVTLLMGLGIAVFFNADSFKIYGQLSSNPEETLKIVAQASQFIEQNTILDSTNTSQSEDVAAIKARLNSLINQNLANAKNPLGLGWENELIEADNFSYWVMKIMGWFVTALAISLGAPFWFDLLKKMIRIRGSGYLPQRIKSAKL